MKSSVSTDGSPKLPTADQIAIGQIAINYGDGVETLSIKNSNDKIVTFSNDEKIIEKVKTVVTTDMKLTDLPLPDGGSDGQILKKSGSTLVWADDNEGSGADGNTITTITKGTGITLTDNGADGNHNYTISVDVDAVINPIKEGVFPSGKSANKVLKVGADGSTLVWGTDEKGEAGVADGNNYHTAKFTSGLNIADGDGTVKAIYVPDASTSQKGVLQIGTGATNAAAGNHTHSNYLANVVATTNKNIAITGTNSIGVIDAPVFSGNVKAQAFYEESDINLKENIKTIEEDIEKISKIKFKEYNFKSDETKTKKFGVIAQELEHIGLTNLVDTDEDGVKSVDYISMLVLAMQEMRNEIKWLKEEISELKK